MTGQKMILDILTDDVLEYLKQHYPHATKKEAKALMLHAITCNVVRSEVVNQVAFFLGKED